MIDQKTPQASLAVLLILQATMLSTLYVGIAPHPPAETPLFGMGPFLAASFSAAAAALILGPLQSRAGQILSGLAAVMALVSFGPQKYFDAQFHLIWPAVIAGQLAAIAIFASLFARGEPVAHPA